MSVNVQPFQYLKNTIKEEEKPFKDRTISNGDMNLDDLLKWSQNTG